MRQGLLFVLLVPAFAGGAAPPAPSVAAELRRYYENPRKPPAWEAAVRRLAGDDAGQRERAAKYLRDLLARAKADGRAGMREWHLARSLRDQIAERIGEIRPVAETAIVLRWFLDEEPYSQHRRAMISTLEALRGKAGDELRLCLVTAPRPDFAIVEAALKQMARDKIAVPAEALDALCQQPRRSVREAARELNKALGRPAPPKFDPVEAMRTPHMRRLLREVGEQLFDAPPADARFVKVTVTHQRKKGEYTRARVGWVVSEKGDVIEIWTPSACRERWRKGKNEEVEARGRKVICTVKVTDADAEEEVARVEKFRAQRDAVDQLFSLEELTGRDDDLGWLVYDIALAQRLAARGEEALAARVLFPALQAWCHRDEQLPETSRRATAVAHERRMLVALVGDRDIPAALALAKAVNEHEPDDLAKRLSEELPRRKDDFVKVKLPTPKEWEAMKKKLSRAEQIDYLCERLRLLNCFQWNGLSLADTQYAEPCGLSDSATRQLRDGKTEVINPYTELTGKKSRWGSIEKERAEGALTLTVADIPALAQHLRDDWHILGVSYWQEARPDHELHRTRPALAGIIDDLAGGGVCGRVAEEGISAPHCDREIERICRWARANEGKSPKELARAALMEEMVTPRTWRWVERRIVALIESAPERATEALRRFQRSAEDDERDAMFAYCWKEAREQGRRIAADSLKDRSANVRVIAALFCYAEESKRSRARQVLREAVASADAHEPAGEWLAEAVALLLRDGDAGSRRTVEGLLAGERLLDCGGRVAVLRHCAKAKMPGAYRFFVPLLKAEGKEYKGRAYHRPVRELFAREIAGIAADDPEVRAIAAKYEDVADRVGPLLAWLEKKAAKAERR